MSAEQRIEFNIETGCEYSYVWSKNGSPDVKGLRVWHVDNNLPHRPSMVYIDGIGKRQVLSNSGIRISAAEMDDLCETWLKARGYTPVSDLWLTANALPVEELCECNDCRHTVAIFTLDADGVCPNCVKGATDAIPNHN